MKIDLFAIIVKTFSSPTTMKYFLFLFFLLVMVMIMKALSDRVLKKFNPKPLKISTLAIILVAAIVLVIISWFSLGR
ncbi:MAG: hypothetical protein WA072_01995 [Candidatus Moraniibacteriota bacterium]